MNRENKYRGFSIELNKWLFGFFMIGLNGESYTIHKVKVDENTTILEYTIVAPESVGQFTGLHDKNGVEIYEGDVVKWCYSKHYWEAVISTIPNNKTNTLYAVETYHNCTTDETEEINTFERSDSRKGVRNELEYLSKDIEIIGNVYQNQELIK